MDLLEILLRLFQPATVADQSTSNSHYLVDLSSLCPATATTTASITFHSPARLLQITAHYRLLHRLTDLVDDRVNTVRAAAGSVLHHYIGQIYQWLVNWQQEGIQREPIQLMADHFDRYLNGTDADRLAKRVQLETDQIALEQLRQAYLLVDDLRIEFGGDQCCPPTAEHPSSPVQIDPDVTELVDHLVGFVADLVESQPATEQAEAELEDDADCGESLPRPCTPPLSPPPPTTAIGHRRGIIVIPKPGTEMEPTAEKTSTPATGAAKSAGQPKKFRKLVKTGANTYLNGPPLGSSKIASLSPSSLTRNDFGFYNKKQPTTTGNPAVNRQPSRQPSSLKPSSRGKCESNFGPYVTSSFCSTHQRWSSSIGTTAANSFLQSSTDFGHQAISNASTVSSATGRATILHRFPLSTSAAATISILQSLPPASRHDLESGAHLPTGL